MRSFSTFHVASFSGAAALAGDSPCQPANAAAVPAAPTSISRRDTRGRTASLLFVGMGNMGSLKSLFWGPNSNSHFNRRSLGNKQNLSQSRRGRGENIFCCFVSDHLIPSASSAALRELSLSYFYLASFAVSARTR